MAPDALQPLYPFTAENHAAWVVTFCITFFIYSLLAVAAKLFIRLHLLTLQSYDFVLVLGMVFLFVHTALVVAACNAGLGRHADSLVVDDLVRYQKLEYASALLSVLVHGSAKISICLLINAISCFEGKVFLANRFMFGTILVGVVSGLLLVALQCPTPVPWATSLDESVCPRRGPALVFNMAMNMATDSVLCVLPIALMWNVQTTYVKKLQVIALFGSRIVVPMTTIPVILSTRPVTEGGDMSWDAVAPTIWLQVSLNLSMVTACVPSLKPVLDSLLGQTIGASIQAPYRLAAGADGSGGLRATTWTPGLESQTCTWVEMRSPRRLLLPLAGTRRTRTGERTGERGGERVVASESTSNLNLDDGQSLERDRRSRSCPLESHQ